MESLTSLDILYIVLSIFVSIIWTLLSIVLFKLIKILWPIVEVLSYYKKVRKYLNIYKKIPELIKEKALDFIWKSN